MTIEKVARRSVMVLAFWLPVAVCSKAGAQPLNGTSSAGIYYEVSGTGEPLVFIHGFSLDRRMWQPQIAALESRFRVIRYDLRGHGRSQPPTAPYAPYDDLKSVLDTLGIERAVLIGHSAGAEVAIDFALANTHRVTRLVLAGPGLGGYIPSPPLAWVTPVFQAAAAGRIDEATRLWLATPLMQLTNDAETATVTRIVTENSPIWSFRTNPARPLTPSAITRLGEIACPTLIVVGSRDLPHIHDIAARLKDGIPQSDRVVIPNAGHLLTIDAAPAFNEALTTFLGPSARR